MSNRTTLITADDLRRPIEERDANWRKPNVDVRALWAELRKEVEGEVRFDPGSIAMYSLDASNYQQYPIGVVVPKSTEDVIATVAACRKFGAPLLSRGGGTSLAGQTCNYAVVIDWTKYLNHVLEINPVEKTARVMPGCIRDDLAKEAKKFKLTYGPDPSTHNRCAFGGMIANNACGAHAQFGGKAVDNTEELDILLYDGTRMTVGWMTEMELEAEISKGGRKGDIYAKLRALRDRYARLIEERFPKISRRVSGYNLDELIPGPEGRFNVARALVGTEGTCVTYLEAKVRLVYEHPERVILMLGYPDVYEAADHLLEILEYNPIALEGIDDRLRSNVLKKPGPNRDHVALLPNGNGWLMVEIGSDTKEEAINRARRLMQQLERGPNPPDMRLYTDAQSQKNIWKVRESGLGASAIVPGQKDTWAGWEDTAVSPEDTPRYMRELRSLYDRYGYNPAIYGHFGMGCIHSRVDFDLLSQAGIDKMKAFLEDATDLVDKYKGSYSGEHGDGQARGPYLHKMFGPELMQAFREFKSIWDPQWKMNPGKVVDSYNVDENLRLGTEYKPWEPETHFRWTADNGSFAHATLRCVGVGKCRRMNGDVGDDTMCPSFMVTREEKHSTRGRARLLSEMLQKGPIADGWRDENVKGALDLCLACKGCKGDCPVNVDVASFKAEFLSHYWDGRIRPRQAYAFGLIDRWARIASVVPGFVNLFTQLPGLGSLAKLAAGVPSQRKIPAFAAESFRSSYARRQTRNRQQPRVILWADTFNNYFTPETLEAAVDVLDDAGFDVLVPKQHLCCGRPLYDHGFLERAKTYLEEILTALASEIETGTPIVVLEPSCCSVFREELTELFPDREDARRLANQTFTLAEFLSHQPNYAPPILRRKAVVHGHCHHKAIMRMQPEQKLLDRMEMDWKMLDSGCCGMAGAFGYEEDKYEVSMAVGNRVLLPAVKQAEVSTLIVSDGFSCKSQIEQSTNRSAVHLAELLQLGLRQDESKTQTTYPEVPVQAKRRAAQKSSMIRAAVITGGVLASLSLLLAYRRNR